MTLPESLHQPEGHHIEVLLPDGHWHLVDNDGWDISMEPYGDWLHFTDHLGRDVAVPYAQIRGLRATRKPMGEVLSIETALAAKGALDAMGSTS